MDNVVIDGGLDLVRARPATLPGRIRECLNYEAGWRRGMTRIDGLERFDGQTSPSSTTGWVIEVAKNEVTGTFTAPETLTWSIEDDTGSSGTLVAVESAIIPDGDIWRLFVVFRAARQRPVWECTITGDDSDAYFLLAPATTSVQNFTDYYPTHKDYVEGLDSHAAILRGAVDSVPGGGTIVGLHFHEDDLYAVRDMVEITVAPGDEGVLSTGMYVYNDAGQAGLVVSINLASRRVNITAVDQDGFTVVPADAIHIAFTTRFNFGNNTFEKGNFVASTTTAFQGNVLAVSRRDGSFQGLNALGVIAFTNTSGPNPILGEILQNQDVYGRVTMSTGSGALVALMFEEVVSAVTVASVATQAELATLWRSSDTGWQYAVTGRSLEFEDGVLDPFDTSTEEDFVASALPNVVNTGVGTVSPWVGDIDTIKVKDDVTITATIEGTASGVSSVQIEVSDFRLPLYEDDKIRGLSVEFRSRGAGTSSSTWKAQILNAEVPTPVNTATCALNATLTEVYAPWAPSDLWGVEMTAEALATPDFGIQFVAEAYGADAQPILDSVTVFVIGSRFAAHRLFLHDPVEGVDVGFIRVSDTVVTSGGWAELPYDDPDTELAKGRFLLKDWTVDSIPSGTEIRTEPSGAGTLVALAVGDINTPVLPGSRRLDTNKSRYQMISYNFYASEPTNAIYGVSGAGMAFWYDGTTLDFIPTGVAAELDKPRHLSQHQSRLCLGYKWGEVYVSDANGPTSFNGQLFAASYGFGDKITGLMPVSGDALGVFTESAVHVLMGNNGGQVSPTQRVINHKVGAIEYTVQSIGNRPIFASFRGIETLETMDQYSDFFTAPLTYDVSPWLLERLQTAAGLEASDKSVVNSVVVRNKNQYRLFFADGYILTLTYVGPEKTPQNTTQKYWFNSDQDQYMRCYATASGVTSDGRDRAFISAEARPPLPFDYEPTVGEELSYVYELDRGRSFDGGVIDAYFDMTHHFSSDEQGGPNVSMAKKYSAFQIHGTCPGTAKLRMSRSVNYEDMDVPELPYEEVPLGWDAMPPEDLPKAKYTKGRMTARGFAVSVRIAHSSAIEFPHTIQLLTFSDDKALKQDL